MNKKTPGPVASCLEELSSGARAIIGTCFTGQPFARISGVRSPVPNPAFAAATDPLLIECRMQYLHLDRNIICRSFLYFFFNYYKKVRNSCSPSY